MAAYGHNRQHRQPTSLPALLPCQPTSLPALLPCCLATLLLCCLGAWLLGCLCMVGTAAPPRCKVAREVDHSQGLPGKSATSGTFIVIFKGMCVCSSDHDVCAVMMCQQLQGTCFERLRRVYVGCKFTATLQPLHPLQPAIACSF
jgi:hypothetical protein